MAGDWIKMRVDLRDDPAVFKLAEILNIDELHVIGCLFCFWAWVDKHAVDGRVDGATSRLVDKVSMTAGFADALVAVGWLQIDESGVTMPNFQRHNGESAKERGLKNARQARWRAKRGADVDGEASTQSPTEAPTREEKRREDISKPNGLDTKARKRAVVIKPDSVSDDVWAGFIAIRTAKKAPISDVALRGIEREAAKAGKTLNEALAICCERGWQGFKAGWLANDNESNRIGGKPRMTHTQATKLAAARTIFGDERNLTNEQRIIDITPSQAPSRLLGS